MDFPCSYKYYSQFKHHFENKILNVLYSPSFSWVYEN